MSQPSIKKNFAYKSVLTLSTYLIGFITFPYVSRVLGVERIGLVNFVDNTVNYFLLFATLGVNILGVREIAGARNDLHLRNRTFTNILGLNIAFTLLTLIVYFLAIAWVPRLEAEAHLFYIGAAKIVSTAFLIEWFFTGIEDFRYITLRSLGIKILYVAAVFVWVKTPGDAALYFLLTTAVVVCNALVNLFHARHALSIRTADLFSLRFLKPNLVLGFYAIMTSMYLTFNVMFLGLVSDNTQVGYYTTAFKLYTVILGFFTAFTSVMLPRMSALVAGGEKERFQQLIDKSFTALFSYCIPLTACSMVLAPQIIHVLSGPGYEGAVLPMRIIMPSVLFVGVAQVLAVQVLMPLKKDRVLLAASITGATLSLLLNFLLVPGMGSIGTACVLLGAECAVTTVYAGVVLRKHLVRIPWKEFLRNLLIAVPCVVICLAARQWLENPFRILGVATVAAVLCWLVFNLRTVERLASTLLHRR